MEARKTKTLLTNCYQLTKKLVVLMIGMTTSLISFFASASDSQEIKDESDVAPSGGVLNYRTGKLDDGTDPVGWYE